MQSRKFRVTLLVIILLSALPLLTSCLARDYLERKQNPPEIQYAEFPFKLTYKLNGEIYTVEGAYVCEFAGLGLTSEYCGFYDRWIGHVKDTDNGVSADGSLFITEKDGFELRCYLGNPYYYMGLKYHTWELEPELFCEYVLTESAYVSGSPEVGRTDDGGYVHHSYDEKYVGKFDIELLDWELSEPLKNNDE